MGNIGDINFMQSAYEGYNQWPNQQLTDVARQAKTMELQSNMQKMQRDQQEQRALQQMAAQSGFRNLGTEQKMRSIAEKYYQFGDIEAGTRAAEIADKWEQRRIAEDEKKQKMYETNSKSMGNEAYEVAENGDQAGLERLRQDVQDKFKDRPDVMRTELARLPKTLDAKGREMLRQYAAAHEAVRSQQAASVAERSLADRQKRTEIAQEKLELEREKERRIADEKKLKGWFSGQKIPDPNSETINRQGKEFVTAMKRDDVLKGYELPADDRRAAADFIAHRIVELERSKHLSFKDAQLQAQAEALGALEIGTHESSLFSKDVVHFDPRKIIDSLPDPAKEAKKSAGGSKDNPAVLPKTMAELKDGEYYNAGSLGLAQWDAKKQHLVPVEE